MEDNIPDKNKFYGDIEKDSVQNLHQFNKCDNSKFNEHKFINLVIITQVQYSALGYDFAVV